MRRTILPLLLSSLFAVPALAGAPPPLPATDAFYMGRELTEADVQGKTLREISLMRNTIFARAGNPFRKDWLNAYFRAQPWYRPAKTWDRTKVNSQDWQNARRLARYEAGMTPAVLKTRVAAVKARIAAGKASPEDAIEIRLLSARLGKWQADTAPPPNRSPLEDPDLLDRQITKTQLDNMSRRELRLLRNMIYARRGYSFKSILLQDYFFNTVWYEEDPKFTSAALTPRDWRNIKMIKSVENTLGGPLKDSKHMQEAEWFIAA